MDFAIYQKEDVDIQAVFSQNIAGCETWSERTKRGLVQRYAVYPGLYPEGSMSPQRHRVAVQPE